VEQDLYKVQDLVQENVPAYVLVRLDDGTWLLISYVPDGAKVRDKARPSYPTI
jgi:twinfilin-like protein